MSTLSSGKIDKNEYLLGEEIIPSGQRSVIEQVHFTYFPLRKALGKSTKLIEDQEKKQIKILEKHEKEPIVYSGEKDSLELFKTKRNF